MKIGLVLPALPAYSETFFCNLINGLKSNGHTVVLFVNPNKSKNHHELKANHFHSYSGNVFLVSFRIFLVLIKTWLLAFKATKRLYFLDSKDKLSFKQKIKNIINNSPLLLENLDWIHFGYGTMTIGRENVAAAIGAKMAVSFRGFDHYVYPIKNPDCYRLLLTKNVKYHLVSQSMLHDLMKKGISEEACTVISPAIDLTLFSAENKVTSNTITIITVARLHWIKGLNYVIEALYLLKQKQISFHYYIIGEGAEREQLIYTINDLGLNNEITLLGKLPATEVKNKLESADLYIQYSNQEGFCNAVLEAQAMGKICIVSDAEGLTENILDNQTGFVVEKRNPEVLAKKIIDVLALSLEQKNTISKKAVERVQTNFNIINQQKKWLTFFN